MRLIIDLEVSRKEFLPEVDQEIEQFYIKLTQTKDKDGYLRNDLIKMEDNN